MILFDLEPKEWHRWLEERPPAVQAMVLRHPPHKLYRLKTSGNRCLILSYGEDGTVCVSVDGTYNLVAFSREVFGVDPNDLEECAPPGPGEKVGDAGMDPAAAFRIMGAFPADPFRQRSEDR